MRRSHRVDVVVVDVAAVVMTHDGEVVVPATIIAAVAADTAYGSTGVSVGVSVGVGRSLMKGKHLARWGGIVACPTAHWDGSTCHCRWKFNYCKGLRSQSDERKCVLLESIVCRVSCVVYRVWLIDVRSSQVTSC